MPLKAYTKGQPRISRHFCGDMHPDDATGSVYHGSVAHISRPSSASVREVAFFSGIGKWRRSRSRFLRGELPSYAQRRGSVDVSAHGPYMLCMASSVRRGVSPATPLRTGFIQRMLFRTAFGTDLLGEETPCQSFIQFLCFHRLFFI